MEDNTPILEADKQTCHAHAKTHGITPEQADNAKCLLENIPCAVDCPLSVKDYL